MAEAVGGRVGGRDRRRRGCLKRSERRRSRAAIVKPSLCCQRFLWKPNFRGLAPQTLIGGGFPRIAGPSAAGGTDEMLLGQITAIWPLAHAHNWTGRLSYLHGSDA